MDRTFDRRGGGKATPNPLPGGWRRGSLKRVHHAGFVERIFPWRSTARTPTLRQERSVLRKPSGPCRFGRTCPCDLVFGFRAVPLATGLPMVGPMILMSSPFCKARKHSARDGKQSARKYSILLGPRPIAGSLPLETYSDIDPVGQFGIYRTHLEERRPSFLSEVGDAFPTATPPAASAVGNDPSNGPGNDPPGGRSHYAPLRRSRSWDPKGDPADAW